MRKCYCFIIVLTFGFSTTTLSRAGYDQTMVNNLERNCEKNTIKMRNLVTEKVKLDNKLADTSQSIKKLSLELKKLKGDDQTILNRLMVQNKYRDSEKLNTRLLSLKDEINIISGKITSIKNALITDYTSVIDALVQSLSAIVIQQEKLNIFTNIILYSYIKDKLSNRNLMYDRKLSKIHWVAGDTREDIEEKIVILQDFTEKIIGAIEGIQSRIGELSRRKEIYKNARHFFDEVHLFSDAFIIEKSYRNLDQSYEKVGGVSMQAIREGEDNGLNFPNQLVAPSIKQPTQALHDPLRNSQERKSDSMIRNFLGFDHEITSYQHNLEKLQSMHTFAKSNLHLLFEKFQSSR